jgi:hypothetical protein
MVSSGGRDVGETVLHIEVPVKFSVMTAVMLVRHEPEGEMTMYVG